MEQPSDTATDRNHPATAPTILLALTLLGSGCAAPPERPAPEPVDAPVATAPATVATEPQPPGTPPTTDPGPPSGPSDAARRAIRIDLGEQRFTYIEDGEPVHSGPISSGRAGHPTPRGRFAVLAKDIDKVSSRYTNQLGWQAWMPYAIQFHGHYFLHEGWLPGYPDSHGCVRVGERDARFLFERLRLGDRVEVVN
ncbi:L,D-transpeptidase [Marichromatium gracile]|uniref:Lipoprotein-anchoring transpeptidase ErfK/SrfK n=1 Tax=Marichromatium gracile TaxID=1048 RepID=A0A4R4A6V9_MARGR|nr:L,D-transpeptidase [Marichromatium gracile]MBK1710393.1 L,D-transpeptidase [Marichromatium gracile]MBO8085685.1 L,D-transpeptidase [Marichromatium sp.]TCW34563.1 lipoprotein-anchoring transpeptidase ErfK/SrfK [Marichromatium gracile]